ncbi:methylamine utilization protein MauJ [Bradyrhizobium sp. SHOUNA76]|uniref:methylamine utilization protein MauJ n=1 Tax=Bradyrhizobium sp. SHOUNA76 TaxID=2908927 RepID=UPI001FF4C6FD|nr:methylamine utilization protein MauJ [Bradyrhizobium sp. SHOUNA76]MCJ9701726.1 hypothetical protein [Bradyrhizobium sp. SHOUNA76]
MADPSEDGTTRWIADFRIESTLILPPNVPELRIVLPDCELSIQNASEDDLSKESLAAQLVIGASDIKEAEALADERIREIMDTLSFGTSCPFRFSRPRFLMDWTPGLEIRDMYAYGGQDGYTERWPELAEDNLTTLATLERCTGIARLRTPLRWFAAGVRATFPEDQFQYFWFVHELIAEMTKESTRVTDKCPRCRSDLFCPTCNTIPEHRPFQKQAIEASFSRLNISNEMQRDLFAIRNAIMHGRTRAEIEEEIRTRTPDFEISQAVDFIWRSAFYAIFNALKIKQSESEQMIFGSPDSVVSQTITMKAHMKMGMHGDPNDPKIENVVLPTITAIRVNERGEEINPSTGEVAHKRR